MNTEPSVRTWKWITGAEIDLRNPPDGCELSDAEWEQIRHHCGIWVNGRLAKDSAPPGSRIAIYAYSEPPVPVELPSDCILFDQFDVVAVAKPAGLSTQRSRVSAHQNLQAALIKRMGDPGLRAVHRLDRDTSGVVLFARNRASTAALHAQFRERTVGKIYHAVTSPGPVEDTFTVEGRLSRVVDPTAHPAPLIFKLDNDPAGRTSETHFKVLSRWGDRALIEVKPITGRTHQIRVHLTHIGAPILGDGMYGDPSSAPRLMLHAVQIELKIGGDLQTIHCPPSALFSPG